MKIGKALRLVMSKWNITIYRLGKLSGVGQSTVGKLIRGEIDTTSWNNTEKLGSALQLIDRGAMGAFYEYLKTPEEEYPDDIDLSKSSLLEREQPQDIAEVLAALQALDLLDMEKVEKLQAQYMSPVAFGIEEIISQKMIRMRLEEWKTYEDEADEDEANS